MGDIAKIFLSILTISQAGCARFIDRAQPLSFSERQTVGELIHGRYESLSGDMNLISDEGRPFILFLVSDSCSVCRAEALGLSQDFQTEGVPANVRLLSLLIGAIRDDALDWRDELQVQWEVGLDIGNEIFQRYCPENKTPCVLVQANGKLTKLIGEHSRAQLEELTGKWE